jgi:hypothetical protein
MALRLAHEGSRQERRCFADRLIAVLDHADPGSGDSASEDDCWQPLWQLAASLVLGPERTPIEIVDGRLVERDLGRLTPPSPDGCIDARKRSSGGVS